MQKMIKPRLCGYLESKNLYSPYQSGSRAFRSTEDNLARLESDCKRAQIEKKYLLAIFLDLSNAFDKLWNGGALFYLKQNEVRGRMLLWIKEFLQKRSFSVQYSGTQSKLVETVNGCPQGSVLSPIIFSLLMNTFKDALQKYNTENVSKSAEVSQFVDDSATWVISRNAKTAVKKGQSILLEIEQWSKDWGFVINPTKTQVLLVHNQRQAPENNPNFPKLELRGKQLEYKKTAKFLGMLFDKRMSWSPHINDLITRCQRDLNLMKCIRGKEWGTDKKMPISYIRIINT